jgi:hypothetical protein
MRKFLFSQALVIASTISIASGQSISSLLTSKHHNHNRSPDSYDTSQGEKWYSSDSPRVKIAEPGYFENIDYLAKGYNVYKGNPFQDRSDPGFTASSVIQLEYSGTNDPLADKSRYVPDLVDAIA